MQSIQSVRTINRRRHYRESLGCEVQLQAIDTPFSSPGTCSYFCRSCDISASGIGLLADHSYPARTRVLLTMECKENGWTRIISRVGSVMWSQPGQTQNHCQLGIQFSDIDQTAEDDLD